MKKKINKLLAGLFLILATHEGFHVAQGEIFFLFTSAVIAAFLGVLVADRLCVSHNHGWERHAFLLLVVATGAVHSAVDGLVLGSASWVPVMLILGHEALRQGSLIGALRANGFKPFTSIVSVTGVWLIVAGARGISRHRACNVFFSGYRNLVAQQEKIKYIRICRHDICVFLSA
jgi:hypothetical protein